MARLDTPTSIVVPGPWLIESEGLLGLDDIYDSYLPRLKENQEVAIQEEIQRRMREFGPPSSALQEISKSARERLEKGVRESQSYAGQERRVTVYLAGGRTLRTERFSEVINHAGRASEVPLGFRSSLTVKPISIVVEVGVHSFRDDELNLEVEPSTGPVSQEVYGALLNWLSDVQSPLWLQKWRAYRIGALMLLSFVIFMSLVVGADWSQRSSSHYLKDEAHKLLAGGVTPGNQTRAVELLLALASDYSVSAAKGPGLRYWGTIVLLVLIWFCLYFCPKVVLGIWRGKGAIKRWRIWIRMVSISIPAFLLSTLGMPWILRWIGLLP